MLKIENIKFKNPNHLIFLVMYRIGHKFLMEYFGQKMVLHNQVWLNAHPIQKKRDKQ